MSNDSHAEDLQNHICSNHECKHPLLTSSAKKYCGKCGIAIFSDCTTYKTAKFRSCTFTNPLLLISSQNAASSTSKSLNHHPHRNNLLDFMIEAATKLNFNSNTYHLAVHYLDSYLLAQDPTPNISQCTIISSVALMLAAKTVELDYKIPFITKLKRYCSLEGDVKEFRDYERKLIKHFNWKLQQPTLIDAIESLLCIGVVFSTDTVQKTDNEHMKRLFVQMSLKLDKGSPQEKETVLLQTCKSIETEYIRVANLVLRDVDSVQPSLAVKALACILFLRRVHHLHPVYPKQLQSMIAVEEKNDLLSMFEYLVMQLGHIFANRDEGNFRTVRTCSNVGSPLQSQKRIDPKLFSAQQIKVGQKENNVNQRRKPLLQIGNNQEQPKIVKIVGYSGVRQLGQPSCPLRFGSSTVYITNNIK